MSRARVAAGLTATFLVGVGVGAIFDLATRSTPPSESEVAAPASSSSLASSSTTAVAPSTTTTAQPSAASTSTAAPPPSSVQPTATTQPAAPLPTAPDTSLPTPPTTEPRADPAAIEAFITDLGAAIAGGGDGFLLERLHPAVFDRYGQEACRRQSEVIELAGLELEVLSSSGPESWDWVLDGLTTPIADAWTVAVVWRQPGLEEQRQIHIAPADGDWRWFTDCGEPLT